MAGVEEESRGGTGSWGGGRAEPGRCGREF